jgi:hypothetical protein
MIVHDCVALLTVTGIGVGMGYVFLLSTKKWYLGNLPFTFSTVNILSPKMGLRQILISHFHCAGHVGERRFKVCGGCWRTEAPGSGALKLHLLLFVPSSLT